MTKKEYVPLPKPKPIDVRDQGVDALSKFFLETDLFCHLVCAKADERWPLLIADEQILFTVEQGEHLTQTWVDMETIRNQSITDWEIIHECPKYMSDEKAEDRKRAFIANIRANAACIRATGHSHHAQTGPNGANLVLQPDWENW